MKLIFTILAILVLAFSVLWYIFIYSQGNTTLLNYGRKVVVVGNETCAPTALGAPPTEGDCLKVVRDDVGHFFIDNTTKRSKLFFYDTYRIEGYLNRPEAELARKYQLDGELTDELKEQ